MTGESSLISIIVVSFNTSVQLKKCLGCLPKNHQIIVVDNGSTDDSVQMVCRYFSHVFLICAGRNLGFGAANNLGLEHSSGDFVLYLNSDAYANEGAVELLASVFSDPTVSAAGGRLLNPDHSLQQSVAGKLTLWAVLREQLFLDGIARKFGVGYWQTPPLTQTEPVVVHQVMGACLMTRKSLSPTFDTDYFLYCEDSELCFQLRTHGQILYVPQAVFVHELGASSLNSRWLSVARYNLGKETYFRKRSGKLAQFTCFLINRIGAVLRLMFGLLGSLFSTNARLKLEVFSKVLTAKKEQIIP
jgi:GT2 family glycosyltransferase